MDCPECHFKNRSGAKFCSECGRELDSICSNCGSQNLPGNIFCDHCGRQLTLPDQKRQSEHNGLAESERKNVTILFSDMSGYTAMAARLDPEEVRDLMSRIFGEIAQVITKYEGFIERFIGDAVMAIFGVPNTHEDDPLRAIKAAREIHNRVEALSPQFEHKIGQKLSMHSGINTGLVVTGEVDVQKGTHGITGDAVNVAARLESLAHRGEILVGEQTFRQTEGYFIFKRLEPQQIKGKDSVQHVYSLIDSRTIQTRFDAAVSKGLVRFVGRKNSMGIITNSWNKVKNGSGQVLGIMGEPGVGKSRLILEFIRSLSDVDGHYFNGRCLPHGRSITYLPFVEILKSFFSIKENQSQSEIRNNITVEIARLSKMTSEVTIPAVQQLLSLDITDDSWSDLEPQLRKKYIFETLKSILICLSMDKPLIVVVDDLQWIDKTSEEFLSYFIDAMSKHAVFLVLLYRPEYTHAWEKKSHYNKLGLVQLTRKSSVKLISAILDDAFVSEELEQLVLKQSAGNPLFIEELISNLIEKGYIEKKRDQIIIKSGFDDLNIPDTIQGIVADRIDKLNVRQKRILQISSVIGYDFGYRILKSVLNMGDELKSYLEKLQNLEFIYQKELQTEPSYRFKHALVQEVAYNSLLLKRRREIHVTIGSKIESLYDNKLEEFSEILAYHYSCGKKYEKAYHYLKLSGKKAEANNSHLEAFNYFKKALHLFDNLSETKDKNEEKLELHNLMRVPIAMLGYPPGSLKILEAGASAAEEVGNKKLLARFYNNISILHTSRGESLLSIANSEKSFQEARQIEDIEMMAPVALSLCYAYVSTCQYDKLIDISLVITGLIEKTGKESEFFKTPFNLYAFILALCGMTMGIRGDFKRGLQISDKGLQHAIKMGHATTLAFAELQQASLLVLKGEGKMAIPHCQNSIKHSEDTEWPTILSQAWTVLAYANYLTGNLEQARQLVTKGLKIQEDSKIEAMLSIHYWIFSQILFASGEIEAAIDHTKKALDLSNKNKERRYEGLSKILMGSILGSEHRRKYQEAEQFILEGRQMLEQLNAKPAIAQAFLELGILYGNAGEKIKGRDYLQKAKTMFAAMGMDYWAVKLKAAFENLDA